MTDSNSICLVCGLCCDGTLIGFVELSSDEMPRVKKVMDFEEVEGNGFFLQPCQKFCDGCTIYDDRPKNCDLFKCGLLQSVEQKEVAFDSALESIAALKQKKEELVALMASSTIELQPASFYFQIIALKKVLQQMELAKSLTPNQTKLQKTLNEFNALVTNRFGLTVS